MPTNEVGPSHKNAINDVLFAVLKYRAQPNKNDLILDTISGLSTDTKLYPHKNKTYSEIPDKQRTKKEK
jgi:hypothetical protein